MLAAQCVRTKHLTKYTKAKIKPKPKGPTELTQINPTAAEQGHCPICEIMSVWKSEERSVWCTKLGLRGEIT